MGVGVVDRGGATSKRPATAYAGDGFAGLGYDDTPGYFDRQSWKQREQSFPPLPPAPRKQSRKSLQANTMREYLRKMGHSLTFHTNVGKCGRTRYREKSVALCQGQHGTPFFSGLVRCASVWECPVCMHAIAAGRAEELRALLEKHRAARGAAYMLTLTLPHDAGDDLRPMRRHVSRAWQFVQSGAPWKRWKKRIGFFGSVRALEVTSGASGWHPHLHVLVLTEVKLREQTQNEFVAFVLARWRKAIARPNKDNGAQYREPTAEHGVTLTESHRDDYIAKLGLADEIVNGTLKNGRHGGRTPLQILHDITFGVGSELEQRRSVRLWMEYANEMFGARQLTWSKGLREAYDIPEQTELELAIAEETADHEELYRFSNSDWDDFIGKNLSLRLKLKALAVETPAGQLEARIIELLDGARGLPPVPF